MSEFLSAPDESSGPTLFDHWSGLAYLPLPSPHQAQRIYVATRLLNYMVGRKPAYVPPLELLLRPLNVAATMVRDADPDAYDGYEKLYFGQGGTAHLREMRRSYLAARHVLANDGLQLRRAALLSRLMDIAEVDAVKATNALDGANAAIKAYQVGRIEAFEKELPVRNAVEWVISKWGGRICGGEPVAR